MAFNKKLHDFQNRVFDIVIYITLIIQLIFKYYFLCKIIFYVNYKIKVNYKNNIIIKIILLNNK